MADEVKEVSGDQTPIDISKHDSTSPVSIAQKRAEMYKSFPGIQSPEPKDEPVAATEQEEAEALSDAPAGKEEIAESSPEAEEKQEVKEKPFPKGDINKALQESRAKLKAANLRARELDAKLADLTRKVESLSSGKPVDDSSVNEEPEDEVTKLRLKVQQLEQQQEQKSVAQVRAEKDKAINDVHAELRAEGIPGFKFAIAQIQRAMEKRFEEGDITLEEMDDHTVWKETYRDSVYPEIKEELRPIEKQEMIDKKKAAKAKAGMVRTPGSAPVADASEEKQPTLDELNKNLIADRQARARKMRG